MPSYTLFGAACRYNALSNLDPELLCAVGLNVCGQDSSIVNLWGSNVCVDLLYCSRERLCEGPSEKEGAVLHLHMFTSSYLQILISYISQSSYFHSFTSPRLHETVARNACTVSETAYFWRFWLCWCNLLARNACYCNIQKVEVFAIFAASQNSAKKFCLA